MTPTEEFKAKIKAGEIFDALALAMGEAVELKITTWVASKEVNTPESGSYLRTKINLVESEIANEIGSQFLSDGKYRDLQTFHLQQVQEGREIILKNLESLQKMLYGFNNTLNQLKQNSHSTTIVNSPPNS